MRQQMIKLVLSGFALLTFTPWTWAMGGEMSVPNGWYLEGDIGSGHVNNTDYPGSISRSGIAGNVNLGYKFMAYVATEIGYTMYPNGDITDGTGTKAGSDRVYSYDLAIRGILPFGTTGFESFAKLGVGRINSSVSIKNNAAAKSIGLSSGQHSSNGVYLGVGAQYYFVPEFAGNIQWQRASGSNSSGTGELFSVGISYIFS